MGLFYGEKVGAGLFFCRTCGTPRPPRAAAPDACNQKPLPEPKLAREGLVVLRLAVGVGVANVLGAPEGQHRQENDGQQADAHAPAGPLTERLAQLPVGNDGEDEGRDADDEAEEPIPTKTLRTTRAR